MDTLTLQRTFAPLDAEGEVVRPTETAKVERNPRRVASAAQAAASVLHAHADLPGNIIVGGHEGFLVVSRVYGAALRELYGSGSVLEAGDPTDDAYPVVFGD